MVSALLLGVGLPAHAALGAVGAVDPATGFPNWYQDANGLTLSECTDAPCPSVRPDLAQPAAFPGNFPATGEDFYWAGWASINLPTGKPALLVQSVEGTFLPSVAQGNQVAFGRIRLRVAGGLVPGAPYTFTYPYGTKTVSASSKGAVSDTVDVGCLAAPCSANFGAALDTAIGPFLTWDPAVAPAAPAGFIGDFGVTHPVVGSPTGNNFFRVDGPNIGGTGINTVQTNLFSVGGKVLAGPAAAQSPASLNYGTVKVGTPSGSQTDTITNTGTAPLSISSTTLGGTNAADFALTGDTCTGATLAPNATCAVAASFTPAGGGGRSAAVTIASNAPASTVIPLTGTGGLPVASLSPTSISFANTNVGASSAPSAATLSNTGNAVMNISSVALGGTNAGDFTIANGCGTTLAAGASCSVNVSFAPTASGARSAALNFADDAGAQSVSLAGNATSASATVNPTSLTYASLPVGTQSASQTVTVTSNGTANLAVGSVTIGGANAGDFSLPSNGCAAVALPSGSSCQFTVAFKPAAAGARSAVITIADNAGNHTVALSGTATATPVTSVSVSPTSINFGNQARRTNSAVRTVTVTNTGNTNESMGADTLGGKGARDFTITSNTCSGKTVVPGASCSISVLFNANDGGAQSATLSIADSAGTQSVSLSGTTV
jgi:hypothetical protein